MKHLLLLSLAACCVLPLMAAEPQRNIIVLLSDDHRYDFYSAHQACPPFLKTPGLDRMAREGVTFTHAFVSTSLCSPSRASILTGQYMHHHHVVDNQRPEPADIVFFPQLLQKAGYQTAFIGKWHMGEDDDKPRAGFDYWAAFKGQGVYQNPVLNINGPRRKFEGYNADVLIDEALRFIRTRPAGKPFFLDLAFKNVHFPFQPAERHRPLFAGQPVPRPPTMADTEENYASQPRWVRERRFGIHGVDHMETTPFDNDPVPDFDEFFRNYCGAVKSMDENIERLLKFLDEAGLATKTMVLYTSDNGFHLGEHGFYDKRDAYETSIRVPLLVRAPGLAAAGTSSDRLVQNVDIAPTLLELAGVRPPATLKMDGRSFLPLIRGESPADWRDHILYEYHWEWNFPATPTLFAIRTERFKYIYHHGIWDKDCLYDLQTDPIERHNLISVPAFQEQARKLRVQLFQELETSGALTLPLQPPAGEPLHDRKNGR
jgi:N-acetylglucosamine-6-sulfatase